MRNVAELFGVMRKIVNSDDSRLDAVRKLLQKHPRLIVFYNFDYELDLLRSLTSLSISSEEFLLENSSSTSQKIHLSEWNGHKHQEIPKTESWVYLVQYTAGSEGWNCIATDATVFYSLPYSYKRFHQAHGRIDRLNTLFTVLHYYVLMSNSAIDFQIAKCLSEKRDFNEAKYKTDISTWPTPTLS
jgi:hypothetical protein